jgi:hypothetical protein
MSSKKIVNKHVVKERNVQGESGGSGKERRRKTNFMRATRTAQEGTVRRVRSVRARQERTREQGKIRKPIFFVKV